VPMLGGNRKPEVNVIKLFTDVILKFSQFSTPTVHTMTADQAIITTLQFRHKLPMGPTS
jgi:hypothetical protein